MSERVKNCTEEELEEIANDRLKKLMTIIDLNLIKDKIHDRLCIEEQESIEEEKCIIGSLPPPECRMEDEGFIQLTDRKIRIQIDQMNRYMNPY